MREHKARTDDEHVVVGAIVFDDQGRAFIQRRTGTQAEFPMSWECIGGHVEPGETLEETLAREIEEETGWTLRRIVAKVCEMNWHARGIAHREIDYIVEVDGDLTAPRLERESHGAFRWITREELPSLLDDGAPGNELTFEALSRAFGLVQRHRSS